MADWRRRPGEDLASALCAAELDGERLSDKDVIAFLYLMIIAGNETTTKLFANALYWWQRNPGARAEVTADPTLIPAWIEETLRYDNSTQLMARTETRGVELHGEKIRAGEKVTFWEMSANRDERVFAEPFRFDVARDPNFHLGFGQGVHYCLGANLARLEMRVMFEELFARYEAFEITGPAVWTRENRLLGLKHLPVRMHRARGGKS